MIYCHNWYFGVLICMCWIVVVQQARLTTFHSSDFTPALSANSIPQGNNSFDNIAHLLKHVHYKTIRSVDAVIDEQRKLLPSVGQDESIRRLISHFGDVYTYLIPSESFGAKLSAFHGEQHGVGITVKRTMAPKFARLFHSQETERKTATTSYCSILKAFLRRLRNQLYPYYVSQIHAQSDAHKTELRIGDIISAINGISICTLLNECNINAKSFELDDLLRKSVSLDLEYYDKISLLLERESNRTHARVVFISNVTLLDLETTSVQANLSVCQWIGRDGESFDIHYVKIAHFSENTPTELERILEKITKLTAVVETPRRPFRPLLLGVTASNLRPKAMNWTDYVKNLKLRQRIVRSKSDTMISGCRRNGIIIDLRDNAGGSVSSALDCSAMFLQKGTILVYIRRRVQTLVEQFKHIWHCMCSLDSIPFIEAIASITPRSWEVKAIKCTNAKANIDSSLLVLINERTASASELIAATLQHHGRATVAGKRSFGKNVAQAIVSLQDGSGLQFTCAELLLPNFTSYRDGVVPDIEI